MADFLYRYTNCWDLATMKLIKKTNSDILIMHLKLLFRLFIFFIFFSIQRTGCVIYTGIVSRNRSVLPKLWYRAILHDLKKKIPEEFDARQKWPHCKSIQKIGDQGSCFSCWAIGTAGMLTDRSCISGKEFEYSAEDILTCCENCYAAGPNFTDRCAAGSLLADGILFWIEEGVVSGGEYNSQRGCKPYSCTKFPRCKLPKCQKACTNSRYSKSYQKDKQLGHGMRYSNFPDLRHIQLEIMIHGPVIGLMSANDEMMNYKPSSPDFRTIYKNGIYRHWPGVTKNYTWHCLRLIGWGTENGQKYWLAANSWGKDWGFEGFLRFPRGENYLQFEEEFAAGYHYDYRKEPKSSESLTKSHLYISLSCLIVTLVCSLS